jgi:hypothetical protein
MRRLRLGEWLAAAGGVALLVALTIFEWYFPWTGVDPEHAVAGPTGFESFAAVDLYLVLVAGLGLALAVAQATQRGPAVPVGTAVLTVTFGVIGTLAVLYRIVNQPGPNDLVDVREGAWIGLAATLAIVVGGWESLRNEHVAGDAPPEDVEVRPAPRIAPDAHP